MAPFRLHFLPFLAYEAVIESMMLAEIFELSQSSRNTFNKIKQVRRSILPIKIVNDSIQNVEISETVDEKCGLVFSFDSSTSSMTSFRKLNGISLPVRKDPDSRCTFLCPESKFNEALVPLLEYLLELFHNKHIALWVEPKKIEKMQELMEHSIFTNCVSFQLKEDSEKTSIESSDLKMLLDRKSWIDGVMVNGPMNNNCNMEFLFEIPRVYIGEAKWVQLENLKNSQNTLIILRNSSLTEDDINQLIQHWLSKNIPKLRRLRLFRWKRRPVTEEVLAGILYEEWDEEKHPRIHRVKCTYCTKRLNCTDGFYIERDDGAMCAVLVKNNELNFVVWHKD